MPRVCAASESRVQRGVSNQKDAPLDAAWEPLDDNIFGAEQPCFGCSPNHPIGLRLKFARKGDAVSTRWTPPESYQGPPGILHGGLVTTVADELAAWTVVTLKGRFGFTASMSSRLKRPIRVGRELIGIGRIEADGRRVVKVSVELAQEGIVAFVGEFTFALLDAASAEKLLERPLPAAWARFCR